MGPLDVESVEECDHILPHVHERVGRSFPAVDDAGEVGHAEVREFGGEPGIPIVEHDRAEAARRQPVEQCVGPVDELPGEAVDEDDRLAVGGAPFEILDLETIRSDAWHGSSSRVTSRRWNSVGRTGLAT